MLPAVFAALVALLVRVLPAAVRSGFGSPAGHRLVWVLAAAGTVLVAEQVAIAARGIANVSLYRRYDEYLLARVMRGVLAGPRLDLFEDPRLAAATDRAVRIVRFGPGELVAGLSWQWSQRSQGFAAAVLVGVVWPPAAAGLTVLWLLVGRRLQADYRQADPGWSDPMRRATYLKQVALLPAWAKETRIFGLADWLGERFGQQWLHAMTELWRGRRVDGRVLTVLLGLIAAGNAAVLVLAVRCASTGGLSPASLTLLVQGVLALPMLSVQDDDVLVENGAVAVPDVLAFERLAATLPAPAGTIPAAGLPGREIRFADVHFGYPGSHRAVFDGLDLRIKAGTSLAVVGLNGAGKTTLIKLLAGLEVPQHGRISIDAIDLADLDIAAWRRTVTAIFQDFVHYELSARDNIAALTGIDDQQLERAAARVGAAGILADLPHGLDTVLSRRFAGGVDLSGGQWQRIALARAMAAVQAGARVLILDEPTAQLDVRAETDIYDRFLELTHGLTTIVISHRFSTVRRADRIVVLDAGRIVEDGGHDELLAANGRYARLFRQQATRYTDAGGDTDE